MTETNFRALCEELLQELCCCYKPWELKEGSYSDAMKRANAALAQPELCNLHREMVAESVARRARVALAQPEPVAPTDEELITMWATTSYIDQPEGGLAFARAALARWGTPANQPVPVNERLPGAENKTTDDECWFWDPISGCWFLLPGSPLNDHYTHWLPHWALPVPTLTNNTRGTH